MIYPTIQQFHFWIYTLEQFFQTVIQDPLVNCEINLRVIINFFFLTNEIEQKYQDKDYFVNFCISPRFSLSRVEWLILRAARYVAAYSFWVSPSVGLSPGRELLAQGHTLFLGAAAFSNWAVQVFKSLIPLSWFKMTLNNHCSECGINWGLCYHCVRAQNYLCPYSCFLYFPAGTDSRTLPHKRPVHKFLSQIYLPGNSACGDMCMYACIGTI